MRIVFVDTAYWIAVVRKRDQWHEIAEEARGWVRDAKLVTTEEVLGEFLTALSRTKNLRLAAVDMVKKILSNPTVKIISQSAESFERGFKLYSERPDKTYSLQDCISMSTMKSESIEEILTTDRNFSQEGFRILMKKAAS